MTLRDALLPLVNAKRELYAALGMRQTRVLIRKRVYASGTPGKGSHVDTDTEIEPRPKVKEVMGVGAMGRGAFEVSKITPKSGVFTVAGYTPAELLQEQPKGTIVFAVLLGPNKPRECKIVGFDERKNFNYVMHLEDLR